MSKTILFLCTGNYYRSRFAEHVFNARMNGTNWWAHSRGLDLEKGKHNVGPMSATALAYLQQLGVRLRPPLRYPIEARREDFAAADRVIATDRTEHEPYITESFSEFSPLTTYWHVKDVVPGPEYDPLDEIYRQVDLLVQRLKAEDAGQR